MVSGNCVIGLTGGIGSGKSTVADLFAEQGAAIIDTDVVAHELTAPGGRAMSSISSAFGAEVVASDGALDRIAMRERVFESHADRHKLENILHPLIRDAVDSMLRSPVVGTAPYVLLVVPLLFESMSYRETARRTLAVDCPARLQTERVQKRSGLATDVIGRIMTAQVPRAIRLQLADDIIVNTAERSRLVAQVDVLHLRYLELAAAG